MIIRIIIVLFGTLVLGFSQAMDAVDAKNSDFSRVHAFLSHTATPLVMLALNVDHHLFTKAYSDYNDINSDGKIDITYDDRIQYKGYFDSNYCYIQDANSIFQPTKLTDPYPNSPQHRCSSLGDWSGNFLNWASMTQLDLLRMVVYGGKRFIDMEKTILQRSHIPQDGHVFVKVFTSDDMHYFTPYLHKTITLCNMSMHIDQHGVVPILRIAHGEMPNWGTLKLTPCTWGNDNMWQRKVNYRIPI